MTRRGNGPGSVQQAGRAALLWARQPTARLRDLPDFLLIGAQRSGTTFLHQCLAGHPQLSPPLRKEIHFFTDQWARGERWYRAHFAMSTPLRGQHRLSFEATPYYLFHPLAAGRAVEVVPQARILVLLRDPVERAYSHYWHSIEKGWETLDFDAALAAEEERLSGAEQALLDGAAVNVPHRVFSYVQRGRYGPQLARWLEHFSPEQLLVLRSEDMFADPRALLSRVEQFLGIEQWQPESLPDPDGRGDRPKMTAAARAFPQDQFADDQADVSKLLANQPALRS